MEVSPGDGARSPLQTPRPSRGWEKPLVDVHPHLPIAGVGNNGAEVREQILLPEHMSNQRVDTGLAQQLLKDPPLVDEHVDVLIAIFAGSSLHVVQRGKSTGTFLLRLLANPGVDFLKGCFWNDVGNLVGN